MSLIDLMSSMSYPSCSELNNYDISPYDSTYGHCVYDDAYAAVSPHCW